MPGELARNRPHYLAAWRAILVGWLGWSLVRFDRWVARWDADLNDEGDGWLYHEDELYWVLQLLVPDVLALRLQQQRTKRMHNDLAEFLFAELQPAIKSGSQSANWGGPDYDWRAAKKRVEEVLANYGAALPSSDYVTSYERRILGEAAAEPRYGLGCQ
ncbi:MAG: hypothetical protein ACJ8F7_20510 [Gemmataceae bacterium]